MSNVKTVPCKYKTGRTLGQGTYAVVKGTIFYFCFVLFLIYLFIRGHPCKLKLKFKVNS